METGLLGLYFFILGIRKSRAQLALLVVFTLALIATVPVRPRDQLFMAYYSAGKQRWRECYLKLEDVNRCAQEARFSVYPRPDMNNLADKLAFLKRTKQNLYANSP
jgi:hypothetical protein